MPAQWDPARWTQNPDGTYRRRLPGEVDAAGAYDEMSKAELVAALELRGLPKTGKKEELVARLEAHDS